MNSNAYSVPGPLFLAASPGDIVALPIKFGILGPTELSGNSVQFTLIRSSVDSNLGYSVNFTRGEDAIWRIYGM